MKSFTNFPDAFDYCRECGRPVTCLVNGEKWKLFPSGRAEQPGSPGKIGRTPGQHIEPNSAGTLWMLVGDDGSVEGLYTKDEANRRLHGTSAR